eukprot:PITA_29354
MKFSLLWWRPMALSTHPISSNVALWRENAVYGYQTPNGNPPVEGAAHEGGKGPSIWDTFSHIPGKIADGMNGDVAVDQYHRYKEDVQLLKYMGMDVYRFSISWPRIFPKGSPRHGGVNEEGIAYYNNLINELLKNEECFRAFGDRVKYWLTINEPLAFSVSGYDLGFFAPGRCSPPFGNCTAGNSATEPYTVGHNLLLAHSAAVKIYRTKYQAKQKGSIGIALVMPWIVPFSKKSLVDQQATQRALDFTIGWFLDPLTSGKYPDSMRRLVGARLPRFSGEEAKDLRGSFDFLGYNYYTTQYAINNPIPPNPLHTGYILDARVNEGASLFRSYPDGIKDVINYTKHRYNNPPIYITETGYADFDNGTTPLKKALQDSKRVKYHYQHLSKILEAVRDGADVRGYIVWALLDNFEWFNGYNVRFGLHYVDYKHNLKRYARASAYWFKHFLKI